MSESSTSVSREGSWGNGRYSTTDEVRSSSDTRRRVRVLTRLPVNINRDPRAITVEKKGGITVMGCFRFRFLSGPFPLKAYLGEVDQLCVNKYLGGRDNDSQATCRGA